MSSQGHAGYWVGFEIYRDQFIVRCGIETADDFSFGQFQWLPRQRILLRSGSPARLGSRAREILSLLLESPGELVTTRTIMAAVWPTTVVEEVALRVHLAALRRILREQPGGTIENIRGIGYRFVPAVHAEGAQSR
jgi:DNA-binding winged helix-turn-helix (wHTH) protein